MDFGLEGFVGTLESTTTSNNNSTGFISLALDSETKQKWFHKQGRCGSNEDEYWRSSKLAKIDEFSTFSDGQQLLSFSAPKSEAFSVDRTSSQNVTFPYFHLTPSPTYSRNTGYYTGCFNGANMHGVLAFTPSQWMELEHQALIYKYITANVPIPSNLINPIRKALDSISSDFSFSGGLLRPNTLGWGGNFHLGFTNNTDPEPGRCRRTDGKKWRCSRDVIADQKYCERHMNRGRHRSRKPVEGKSACSAAASTTTTPNATNTKLMSNIVSPTSASVVETTGGSDDSNSNAIAQQQHLASPLNRLFPKSPTYVLKSKENPFMMMKQQITYEENSRNEFGIVSSDSLLNSSHQSSTQNLATQETEYQHSVRQFMDEWPKSNSDRSAVSWPEVDVQSDRNQLSISIPKAASDFISSTSSPNNENETPSPLRLSRKYDPMQMGLGASSVVLEPNRTQANWIPISWETSIGGPLGEALQSTNSSTADCKNSSALNLMTEGWDHSPSLGSSSIGVLPKTTFGSFSNSSAGSSPRAENNKTHHEGASLDDNILRPTLVHSSSLPAF